jgi:poly(3-hydroxybutyrate) depolymerase
LEHAEVAMSSHFVSNRHLIGTSLCLALAMFAFGGVAAAAEKIAFDKQSITFAGQKRNYWLYVPPEVPTPAPLLVLLHGSGQPGDKLVRSWKDTADKQGIILAAPESLDHVAWNLPADGPDFLRDVVEEIKTKRAVDPRRVYLFGFSAGAHFALLMSVLESEYFAATAFYGGAMQPKNYMAMDQARRKIPIALYGGSEDDIVPLPEVQATRDELSRHGWNPTFKQWPHDHNYYTIEMQVNKAAWEFLEPKALEGAPVYQLYNFLSRKR